MTRRNRSESVVSAVDLDAVRAYISGTRNPTLALLFGTAPVRTDVVACGGGLFNTLTPGTCPNHPDGERHRRWFGQVREVGYPARCTEGSSPQSSGRHTGVVARPAHGPGPRVAGLAGETFGSVIPCPGSGRSVDTPGRSVRLGTA